MIISKTPYRISLFGGGTDHPSWFERNGGHVISFSIDKYCYISVRLLPPFFDYKYRIAYSRVETVKEVSHLAHPVVRECIKKFSPQFSLEVHHDGDLPARSGIGSSSAFTVGLINTLLSMQGLEVSKKELASLAIQMEQEVLKENVGWQDQIACSIGGLNSISFGGNSGWVANPINLNADYLRKFLSKMVLVYTGIQRNSSEISIGLLKGIVEKKKQLDAIAQLAGECLKILSNEGNLDQIGPMLDEGWHLKKEANPYSSSHMIDDLYEEARRAGATGGKVLGAGGGGFMLFWMGENSTEDFLRKFKSSIVVPFNICNEGTSVIYTDSKQKLS